MQSHIIFGAGLIGGFLGGVFTSLGLPTKLICRPKIQQKLANGLLLTDYLGNKTQVKKLAFLDNTPNTVGVFPSSDCDYLWITVKCTGVAQASDDIASLIGPNTVIFCCQNGLGSEQIIKEKYPQNTVLRVMVPFNVAEPKTGHLHRGSEGGLYIEMPEEQVSTITSLVQQLDSSLLPVTTTTDITALLWAKLQLNLGNAVNALSDIPVKAMLEQRSYRLVNAILMKELLAVTSALDISLPKLTALPANYLPYILRLPDFIYKSITSKVLAIDPTVRTSMWWDLSQGKKTEIDHLNGAVVQASKKLNIPCPANQAIIALVKETEKIPLSNRRGGISSKDLLFKIRNDQTK